MMSTAIESDGTIEAWVVVIPDFTISASSSAFAHLNPGVLVMFRNAHIKNGHEMGWVKPSFWIFWTVVRPCQS